MIILIDFCCLFYSTGAFSTRAIAREPQIRPRGGFSTSSWHEYYTLCA